MKRVFLTIVTALLICQTACSGCFAQEKQTHLYSTWNILELDTCASAWLIKRFIDKEAEFKFYPQGELIEEGIAFDTPDAEFCRTQNMCTYQTLLEKYKIKDQALIKIGEMIHEIEVNYWQLPDEQTQKLNQKMCQIIDTAPDPLDCFRQAFVFLDQVYINLK